MVLKLFIDYISQPSRAILAFCLMNKIPHEIIETKIFEGKNRTDEFKRINPLGKVPAIDDDGFFLFESHAILRYLSKKHNVKDHWYPEDPKKMALVDRYLDWHHSYIRSGSSTTVFHSLFAPKMGIKSNVDLHESTNLLKFSLKFINDYFLKDSKFIAGDEISIADLSCFCEVINVLFLKANLAELPNLSAWLRRVLEYKEIAQVHEVFFKVLKKFNPDPKF